MRKVGSLLIRLVLVGCRSSAGGPSPSGATALHRAAAGGQTEVVTLLLARGAEPNAQGAGGVAPLHWAAEPRW